MPESLMRGRRGVIDRSAHVLQKFLTSFCCAIGRLFFERAKASIGKVLSSAVARSYIDGKKGWLRIQKE